MPNVPRRKKELERVKLKLDVGMCDLMIRFALSKYPTHANLANMKNLIEIIDIESYVTNYDIYNRLSMIKLILDGRINHELTEMTLIKNHVLSNDQSLSELAEEITWSNDTLTTGDATAIIKYIDDKLKYYFYELMMPQIIDKWVECQKTGFNTDPDTLNEINDMMAKCVSRMQNSTIATNLLRRFSFASPDMADAIRFVVEKAHKPTSILQTGIRQLNAILGPGFRSGKLYVLLGLSGRFKSGTLLNIADQIKHFNPQLDNVVNGKRNTILFVTMENDIEETIERMYAMYSKPGASLFNSDNFQVTNTLIEDGGYKYTSETGIDIDFRYFHNLEISTNDLYGIIDDMEKNNAHCIGVILDYIKRIDSTINSNGDEVLRASYVAKELKNIAEHYQIPVITAQQINRQGNQIVDAAMKDGKSDLIRFIGNSDVGASWGVIEEADWVCIINLEVQRSTGRLYLSFKRTKARSVGQADNTQVRDYFNHPFSETSEMKLETDLDKDGSLSITSLASDLDNVDQDKLSSTIRNTSANAQARPVYERIVDKNVTKESLMEKIRPIDVGQ